MTNKSQAAYEAVLGYINTNILDLTCEWFMTDYEQSLRNAIVKIIPTVQLTACWFHFCQAVKRNVRKHSCIIEFIRKNDDAKRLYYMLLCLPLLPPVNIASEFNSIKQKFKELNPSIFDQFMAYFENQWLKKVCF